MGYEQDLVIASEEGFAEAMGTNTVDDTVAEIDEDELWREDQHAERAMIEGTF